jgi:ribonucrease Y
LPQTGLGNLIYYVALAAIFFIGLIAGGAIIFFARRMVINRQLRVAQRKASRTVAEANEQAKELAHEAKIEIDKTRAAAENEARQRRNELQRQENRLSSKSENLDRKLEGLEQRDRNLNNKEKSIETIRAELTELKDKQLKQLEIVSGMSTDEARKILMEKVDGELRDEGSRRIIEWEKRLREESDKRAQEILVQAIQRSASEIVSESTVVTVPLPSDEMKGRLIGREGRNIRALEQATGVDLIVDDTPEAVTLSSFDGVRREIARLALNKLILNGRIHPTRIEEVVAKTKEEVEASIYSTGEQAAYQIGVQIGRAHV